MDLTISKCKTLMTFRNTIRALDNEGLNGAYNQVQQRRNTLLTSGMTDDVTKVQRELKYIDRLREGKNFPETTFIDSDGGKTVTIENRGVNTEVTAGRFINQDNTEPGDGPPPPQQCGTASFKWSSTEDKKTFLCDTLWAELRVGDGSYPKDFLERVNVTFNSNGAVSRSSTILR